MNNRSGLRTLAIAALVIAAAAFIGIGAYNAGVAHGIAQSGQLPQVAPPPGGAVPYPYPYAYGWRPWGFGFHFFPFFPFLGLLLFFLIIRGLFWRGPWRGGWADYRCAGVPPAFEEWHRRAHAGEAQGSQGTSAT